MAADDPILLPIEPPGAARHYALLSLVMLLGMTLLLSERVPGVWSLLPLLLGAGFLMIEWRDGPIVVLFLLACLLASENVGGDPPGTLQVLFTWGFRWYAKYSRSYPQFDDFLLAGTCLVYVASYHRFLGFARHVFPLDVRERPYAGLGAGERRRLIEVPQRRAPDTLTLREFGLLALAVPLWTGGAAALWRWATPEFRSTYEFEIVLGSALKVLYLFGVPLLLFRAGLAYSNQCRASREEGLLFLQEQLWRETRREQSRTNRWLTWSRLRSQRRKENR